jgi:hypothetical protein
MSLQDLSAEALAHLINDVFLPVANIAAELDRDRQLASATLQKLGSDHPTIAQRERILSALIGRSVVTHYVRLREHYDQHQSEIGAWTSIRGDELVDALSVRPERGNADLFYQDPEVVRHFVLGCQRQLTSMSARLRELTY